MVLKGRFNASSNQGYMKRRDKERAKVIDGKKVRKRKSRKTTDSRICNGHPAPDAEKPFHPPGKSSTASRGCVTKKIPVPTECVTGKIKRFIVKEGYVASLTATTPARISSFIKQQSLGATRGRSSGAWAEAKPQRSTWWLARRDEKLIT